MQNQQLLGKAVVALERKLRDSCALVSALEADLAVARQQSAELPAVRQSLADSQAARDSLEQKLQGREDALKQARCEVASALDERAKAQEAAQAATARQQELDVLLQQSRADAEALRLDESRARGQVEVLLGQVQQLETANSSLRQDSKSQAAQLRAAYEREAELLAQVSELQAQACLQQRSHSGNVACKSRVPTHDCSNSTPLPPSAGEDGLDAAHRGLFLAAAADLTRGFSSLLEQADAKAAALDRHLSEVARAVHRLGGNNADTQAELEAAQQHGEEQAQAAAALLETNLRLHETVLALLERRPASAGVTSPPVHEERSVGAVPGGHLQQQQRQPPGRAAPARLRRGQHSPGGSGPGPLPEQAVRSRLGSAGAAAHAQQPLGASQGQASVQRGTSPRLGDRPCRQQSRARVAPPLRREATARPAAVDAALQLLSEHRSLLAVHRTVAREVQAVTGALARARGGSQLELLQRHAALQGRLRDVAARLEDRAVRLAALRQQGLL